MSDKTTVSKPLYYPVIEYPGAEPSKTHVWRSELVPIDSMPEAERLGFARLYLEKDNEAQD